jgi:hypothetical protein
VVGRFPRISSFLQIGQFDRQGKKMNNSMMLKLLFCLVIIPTRSGCCGNEPDMFSVDDTDAGTDSDTTDTVDTVDTADTLDTDSGDTDADADTDTDADADTDNDADSDADTDTDTDTDFDVCPWICVGNIGKSPCAPEWIYTDDSNPPDYVHNWRYDSFCPINNICCQPIEDTGPGAFTEWCRDLSDDLEPVDCKPFENCTTALYPAYCWEGFNICCER